jgi:hypothetical protein
MATSEVHALSFSELSIQEFIPQAKNQNTHVKIPALAFNVRGSNKDGLLCPVRAFKAYRVRTMLFRKANPKARRLVVSMM